MRQLAARLDAAGMDLTPALCRTFGMSFQEASVWREQSPAAGLMLPFPTRRGACSMPLPPCWGSPRPRSAHEGQAAMRLEHLARQWRGAVVEAPFRITEDGLPLRIDWNEAFSWGLVGHLAGEPLPALAFGFHHAVAAAAVALARRAPWRDAAPTTPESRGSI